MKTVKAVRICEWPDFGGVDSKLKRVNFNKETWPDKRGR